MSEMANVAGPLEKLFAQMQAAQQVADPATAAHLETLAKQLRTHHAEFAAAYDRVSAQVDQQISQNQQHIDQIKANIDQAKQDIQKAKETAAKKPESPPPPPPPPPIDPALGRKLRTEILERFGGKAPDQPKEDWELWNQLGDWK